MLSGTSAGAASTTFGGSPADGNEVAAEIDGFAGVEAVTAVVASTLAAASTLAPCAGVIAPTAGAIAGVGAAVLGDEAFAGIGAAAFVAREAARADLLGLSFGGAAATAAGGAAGFAGAVMAAGAAVVIGATGAAGAMEGTALARTPVTIARAAIGAISGSLERSINESTTPTPAVAPIAVATKTTRAVRAKLGAGAK